jgi:hypothetical protein
MRVLGLKYKEKPRKMDDKFTNKGSLGKEVSSDKEYKKSGVNESNISRPHKTYG